MRTAVSASLLKKRSSPVPSSAVQPLLALLASPVGGNPTQYMFEKAFAFHELDWRYLTFEVEPADLANAVLGLKALGFHGDQCADPHKRAVLPLLDRATETAAAIGVVNLVLRQERELVGENTEGRGIVGTIGSAMALAGKRVVLLGAGGWRGLWRSSWPPPVSLADHRQSQRATSCRVARFTGRQVRRAGFRGRLARSSSPCRRMPMS